MLFALHDPAHPLRYGRKVLLHVPPPPKVGMGNSQLLNQIQNSAELLQACQFHSHLSAVQQGMAERENCFGVVQSVQMQILSL